MLPIANHAPASTVYIGSLSKLTLPSLRIGHVIASETVTNAIAGEVMNLDRQGSVISEEAVANLIASGALRRHIRKSHAIYARRRMTFAAALRRHLAGLATFAMPKGGLAFWVRFHDEALLDRIDRHAETATLRFAPSTSFATPPAQQRGLRLGFASLNELEASRALALRRQIADTPAP